MNNSDQPSNQRKDNMLPEYDFSDGVRGKHYRAYHRGHSVTTHHPDGTTTVRHYEPEPGAVILDPDLRPYFPDSGTVNKVLRGLLELVPDRSDKTRRSE